MRVHAALAKINLHLAVLAREETGYHQIETLFCAVDLADEITIALEGDGIELAVEGADLGPARENLAYRAAVAFFTNARIRPAARIRIRKNVPHGAGLGGGSSDAATTLLALNALHEAALTAAELLSIGLSLGSDVPFFLLRQPFALGWGHGQRLLALPPPPPAPTLLIVPELRVATVAAYDALAAARRHSSATVEPAPFSLDMLRSFDSIARIARNDFEPVVFEMHPELLGLRRTCDQVGAIHAALTGSGSAFFAIFDDDARARRAADSIRDGHPGTDIIHTTTCARIPPLLAR